MKNKRRNHSALFKAKVALEAAKGNKTMVELVRFDGDFMSKFFGKERVVGESRLWLKCFLSNHLRFFGRE